MFTYQQIAKEYRKRHRCFDRNAEVIRGYYTSPNPFEYSKPLMEPAGVIQGNESAWVVVGSEPVELEQGKVLNHESLSLIYLGKNSSCLAWAYRRDSEQFLAISEAADQELVYGEVYSGDGFIQIWSVEGVRVSMLYSIKHSGLTAHDLKWLPSLSSDHALIGTFAAALANGRIEIYNAPLLRPGGAVYLEVVEAFALEGLVFQCLAWVIPNNQLVAGSQDGSLAFFRSGSLTPFKVVFAAHQIAVTSVSFCPGTLMLASCSLDGTLKLWNKDTCTDTLNAYKRWSYSVAWQPQGNYLFYDNEGVVAPHKVIKVDFDHFDKKKYIDISKQATLSSCYSAWSGYAYIASSEGHVGAIFLNELEKSFKKRKSPWSLHHKVFSVRSSSQGLVFDTETRVHNSTSSSPQELTCAITKLDLCYRELTEDLVAMSLSSGLVAVLRVNLPSMFALA